VNGKLTESAREGDAKQRVEAIHALAGRGAAAAVGELLKAAADNDPAVRQEAIAALGVLADKPQLGPMLAQVISPKEPGDRAALAEALGKAILRIDDKAGSAKAVLAEMGRAPGEAKPTLVLLLGKSGAPEALTAVRAALKDADPAMRDAAVRALASWPNAAASDDLLDLVASGASRDQKQLALEGYLRLAAASADPTAMYLRVLKRVDQVNDRKLVLEGLGLTSESPEALQVALEYLSDKSVRANAGVAALRIASRLRDRDPQLARSSLKKVLDVVDHPDVRQRAQEVLNDLDKYADHILDWVGVGPFTEKGKDGPAVYATPFEPEKPGAQVKWEPITKGLGSWDINLEATFGALDCCAAYLRTRVWSDVEQEALLEMGSDDAVKAWLNGKLVFDQWTENSAAPRQHRVPVKLAQGWNELMLKVVDQHGGWVAACRIRKPDGTALEGLKVQAQ
jgi:HEAT repeat protein